MSEKSMKNKGLKLKKCWELYTMGELNLSESLDQYFDEVNNTGFYLRKLKESWINGNFVRAIKCYRRWQSPNALRQKELYALLKDRHEEWGIYDIDFIRMICYVQVVILSKGRDLTVTQQDFLYFLLRSLTDRWQ